jgi:phage gpG-like protein
VISVEVQGGIPKIEVGGLDTMRRCAEIMRHGILTTFSEGGYPGRWAPLKSGGPSYLFRGGDLWGSINQSNQVIGDDFAEVYSRGVRYGIYHQTGTRKMLARPFMVWRQDMIDAIVDTVGESARFEGFVNTGEYNISRSSE